MVLKEIRLPEQSYITMIGKWNDFLFENRYRDEDLSFDKIKIDFKNVGFLKPFHLVSLACMIEEYAVNGLEVEFESSRSNSACGYIDRINFFEFWQPEYDRTQNIPSTKQSVLNLIKIDRQSISSYVVRAAKYFKDNFLTSKDLTPLNLSLAELFNNIFDHSKSQVDGFSISQYYKRSQELVIAVCDFGVGIPSSINEFLRANSKPYLSELEALEKAFINGFTIKSVPNNGGLGLDNLKSCTLECGGKITIITNRICYKIYANKPIEMVELVNYFEGTMIYITLDVSKLDEEELEEYDFADIDF